MDDCHTDDDRTGNRTDREEHDVMADHHKTDRSDDLEDLRTRRQFSYVVPFHSTIPTTCWLLRDAEVATLSTIEG